MLMVVEQVVFVNLPVECRSALCLILITAPSSLLSCPYTPPTLPITEFLFSLLHYSCGILSLSNTSIFPKTFPCFTTGLPAHVSFIRVYLCPLHYNKSDTPVFIILLSAELDRSQCFMCCTHVWPNKVIFNITNSRKI